MIGQILCRLIMFTWDYSRIHTSKTDRVMKFYITVTSQQGEVFKLLAFLEVDAFGRWMRLEKYKKWSFFAEQTLD